MIKRHNHTVEWIRGVRGSLHSEESPRASHICIKPPPVMLSWQNNLLPSFRVCTSLYYDLQKLLSVVLQTSGSCRPVRAPGRYNAPWFICRFRRYINCLFVYLTSFLTFIFPYTFFLTFYFLTRLLPDLSTSFIIDPFRFHASVVEATKPGFRFWVHFLLFLRLWADL